MEIKKQHFRIQYKKGEELRYTANLDVHKVWERYFRRSKIPLAYSKGFHPQPRINQALPLPLGMLSDFELLDFWIESEENYSIQQLETIFAETKQPGIDVIEISEILEKQKSLQSMVHSVSYKAEQFYVAEDETSPITVQALLGEEEIIRIRRKKEYNLRSLILELGETQQNPRKYSMHLMAIPGKTGRPDEVLSALGHDPNHFRITRTEIILGE